jgi:hypothetical protein
MVMYAVFYTTQPEGRALVQGIAAVTTENESNLNGNYILLDDATDILKSRHYTYIDLETKELAYEPIPDKQTPPEPPALEDVLAELHTMRAINLAIMAALADLYESRVGGDA